MIDVAVVSAILSVPGAIHSIRELLKARPEPDRMVIEAQLDLIERKLLRFADIGDLFDEAKAYHEKLTQLDLAMGELVEAVARPVRRGGFDADEFNRELVFSRWRTIRETRQFLPALVHFMQRSTRIGREPLRLSESGHFIDGDGSFRRFIELKLQIDGRVKDYESGNRKHKEEMCDLVDQFSQHVRHEILQADSIIIENAETMARTLLELRGHLTERPSFDGG